MKNVDKDYGLDVIRATAAFMVVVLHVAAGGFYRFDSGWVAINLYDAFVRVAVPLFLMVSGVLLLARREPLGDFLTNRAARILPAFVFWSLVYAAIQAGGVPDVTDFLKRLASGPIEYHLWYFYALFGIYAFVPVMRVIHKHASVSERVLYLSLWAFVACLWPATATHFRLEYPLIDTFWLHSFAGLGVYVLLGATLHQLGLHRRFPIAGGVLFLVSSLAVAWITYSRAVAAGQPDEVFYSYLSPFVLTGAIGAFLFLGSFESRDGRIPAFVRLVSQHSLGIYCSHVIFIELARSRLGLSLESGSPWWTVPLTSVCVFLLALGTSVLLGKRRILRRVV